MSALAVVALLMNGSLVVAFDISPTLKEPGAPPKLRVTMRNDTDKPLEVMRFESDACFAQFFLELPLTLPDQTTPPPAGCPIRSWPGVKGTLAAGAEESRELDLATIFPGVKWVRGRYRLPVKWNPKALEAYFGGKFVHDASQTSLNVQAFDLVNPLGKFRIERGKEIALPDGARFAFSAHGHKRTMEGGPPSPLIIHGGFAAPKGKALEPFEVQVFADESRVFSVGDGFTFELVKNEYDAWMDLVYFGKR